MSESSVAAPSPPRAATGLARSGLLVLALVCVVVAVSVVPGVRDRPGFSVLWDGWFQCGGYVLTALLAAGRAVLPGARRAAWVLVAVALALRCFAFLWTITVLRPSGSMSYPSIADAAWLASALCLLGALFLLARFHLPRTSHTLVLDAVLGGVTAAALGVVLLYGTLLRLTAPGTPTAVVATNLAYPTLDVALLVLVTGLFAATLGRLPAGLVVMALGIVLITVVDCVFLYRLSAGTYRPGSILTPLSLTGTALVALSAWMRRDRSRQAPPEGPASLVVPTVLALCCVGVLVYSSPGRSPAGDRCSPRSASRWRWSVRTRR